jgi:hypothetical protein
MCNAHNHPPDCTCGWGGDGHLGQSADFGRAIFFTGDWYFDGRRHCWRHAEDFCRPTRCPRCGDDVYFVRHNGGSVWFDELGWPWPKHGCFPDDPKGRAVSASAFSAIECTTPTVGVPAGFAEIVATTPGARLGLAKRVVALGDSIRIVEVLAVDGDVRDTVVEDRIAATRLVGTFAIHSPLGRRVTFVCDDRVVLGWWLSEPPGRWRGFDPAHVFARGELVRHAKFGVGTVLAINNAERSPWLLNVVFETGETKKFFASHVEWLDRLHEDSSSNPPASDSLVDRVASGSPDSTPGGRRRGRCPHCQWNVRNLHKHLRNHHPEVAT